jgi:hypothetical protein
MLHIMGFKFLKEKTKLKWNPRILWNFFQNTRNQWFLIINFLFFINFFKKP